MDGRNDRAVQLRKVAEHKEWARAKLPLPCDNLAFSGGGGPGIYAHLQAIKELHEQKYIDFSKLKRVVGTSIGSLAALMVALEYTPEQMEAFLKSLDLSKIANKSINPLRAFNRLVNDFGIHDSEELFKIIQKILIEAPLLKRLNVPVEDRAQLTFGELQSISKIELHVCVVKMSQINRSVNRSEQVDFSYENAANTPIADIVLASASPSPIFPPVYLKETEGSPGEYHRETDKSKLKGAYSYTDGGWRENYWLELFDQRRFLEGGAPDDKTQVVNPKTLGLALVDGDKLDPSKSTEVRPIPHTDIAGMAFALIEGNNPQQLKLRDPTTSNRTIQLNRCGAILTEFELSLDKQKEIRGEVTRSIRTFVGTRAEGLSAAGQENPTAERKDDKEYEAMRAHRDNIARRIAEINTDELTKEDIRRNRENLRLRNEYVRSILSSNTTSGKEEKPNLALPSIKKYVIGALLSGVVAAGSAVVAALAITTAVLSTVAFLVSNPIGWGLTLGVCALFLANTVRCGFQAYQRYKTNKILNHFPESAVALNTQSENLKKAGVTKETRHYIMKNGILFKSQQTAPTVLPGNATSIECEIVPRVKKIKPKRGRFEFVRECTEIKIPTSDKTKEKPKHLFFNPQTQVLFFETQAERKSGRMVTKTTINAPLGTDEFETEMQTFKTQEAARCKTSM